MIKQVAPNKESKSFLKPPKILCRARALSTAPNKRASLGVSHVKLENKGAQVASGKNSKKLSHHAQKILLLLMASMLFI